MFTWDHCIQYPNLLEGMLYLDSGESMEVGVEESEYNFSRETSTTSSVKASTKKEEVVK